jgi:N6-adenosine-specific RNA methylase IME4
VAEALRIWLKRRKASLETVNEAVSYRILATKKLGAIRRQQPRAKGAREVGTRRGRLDRPRQTQTLAEQGISKEVSALADKLVDVPDKQIETAKRKATEEGREFSTAAVIREIRHKQVAAHIETLVSKESAPPTGQYDVIVIDPPWPMEKIERDCRPNQVLFGYPVMTEEELAVLELPMAENCHVWVWTTHKFLPMAFRLLAKWDLKYCCTFVWHKPGGFQPAGLPQFNCEFALYARRGSPVFADTKDFMVCFNGERGEHSEKPDEFYELLRRTTAGQRLDMFNRRKIDGFQGWGKEAVA